MARRRFGQLLLVAGLVSLILGSWSGAQFRTATVRRLFFVDPFGMAAGEDGRVYVGVDRRDVHAYAADGQPLAAWTVALDAGRFRLRDDGAGRIEVARETPPELRLYDRDGRLVSQQADAEAFARFGPEHDARVQLADGSIYELAAEGLTRTHPLPRTLIVPVPRPPLAWLGSRPLRPVAALIFAGALGLLVGAVLTAASTRRS